MIRPERPERPKRLSSEKLREDLASWQSVTEHGEDLGKYFLGSSAYWVDSKFEKEQERMAHALAHGDPNLIAETTDAYNDAERAVELAEVNEQHAAAVKATKREATKRAKDTATRKHLERSARGGKAKKGKPIYHTEAILAIVGTLFESRKRFDSKSDPAQKAWDKLEDIAKDQRLDGLDRAMNLNLTGLEFCEVSKTIKFSYHHDGQDKQKSESLKKFRTILDKYKDRIKFTG